MRGFLCFLLALLLPLTATAATETVLLVDNSGSMIFEVGIRGSNDTIPPADPDRLAVLATILLERIQDPGDRLHILNFQQAAPEFVVLPNDVDAIREMYQGADTRMRAPLTEAHRILSTSQATRRLFILMTDGAPTDIPPLEVAEARRILGLDKSAVPYDFVVIGLASSKQVREQHDLFLKPLAGDEGRFVPVSQPGELIDRFTGAYAQQLGSKPETGTLSPGASYTVDVGKYVREVIVLTAATDRVGPYAVTLERDGRDRALQPGYSGDNGCSIRYQDANGNPSICKPPFHNWAVWKEANNPKKTSRWRLNLDRGAKSDVAFGFILRYDLGAELVGPPAKVRVGEPVTVTARLVFEGKTFDEDAFYGLDGFEVVAMLGDQQVPMSRQPDNTFVATLSAAELGQNRLRAVFRNTWMDLPAETNVLVEGYLPLTLAAEPLDFGGWDGQGVSVTECRQLRWTGTNSTRVPLDLIVSGLPDGAELLIGGDPTTNTLGSSAEVGDAAELPIGATEVQVCLASRRCCAALDGADVGIVLRGRDPHYHGDAVAVPVAATVRATGFYACWKYVIWAVLGALFVVFVLVGLIKPNDFPADLRIRVAGSERKLTRASAMMLRDQPGGRRGFYRNATVGLDASGGMVGPRTQAWLRLTAKGGDEIAVETGSSLETKDRRSRKWEAINTEAGPAPMRRRVEYRVGELYFKIE